MLIRLLMSIVLIFVISLEAHAQANFVGAVRVAMEAKILRGGKIIKASAGTMLEEKDTLVTEQTGSIGIVLKDNSVISLGPNSRFQISEFNFAPRENKLGLLGKLTKGTLEYISGKISKIARDAAKFRTPFTTIAVRGTRLLIRVVE